MFVSYAAFPSGAFRRNLRSTAVSGNVLPRTIPAFLRLPCAPIERSGFGTGSRRGADFWGNGGVCVSFGRYILRKKEALRKCPAEGVKKSFRRDFFPQPAAVDATLAWTRVLVCHARGGT